MSEIALYEVLTKLGVEPEQAKAAVADVASAKEVATKSDLKIGITELKAELKYIRWFLGFLFAMIFAIFLRLFLS